MLNYDLPPDILRPLVPAGTQLDSFRGRTIVSLVGFLFERTRVYGLPIPFHINFEEVNLRFYVRRETPHGPRRGVVFIKEIVPRAAIAYAARVIYNEPYVALPMRHEVRPGHSARYSWKFASHWHSLAVTTIGHSFLPQPGSEEEFITEHYWGYTAQPHGSSKEYEVRHPQWQVYSARNAVLGCDIAALYGPQFAPHIHGEPASAFLAQGSPVTVSSANIIRN